MPFESIGFGQTQMARLLPNIPFNIQTMSDRTVDLLEEAFDVGIFTALQKFDVSPVARQLDITEVLLFN